MPDTDATSEPGPTTGAGAGADGDRCSLCDLPTPEPPVTDDAGADDPDAVAGTFCCRGCLEVARSLDDGFGAAEVDPAAELREGTPGAGGDRDDADGAAADGETAFLRVDGMHCATCEAFIESRAVEREGVTTARASYATDTCRLTYDPDVVEQDDLPAAVAGLGYDAAFVDDDDPRDDEEPIGRLLVGGFFGMMVMLWYVLFFYPAYLGWDSLLLFDVTGTAGLFLRLNVWVMTSVVLGYTGYPLLRGAYVSLRAGHPNMDLLVALAAGTAYVYSVLATLAGGVEIYFDITVAVVLVVSVGGYYEDRVKRRAADHLTALTRGRVSEARRRTADGTETVPVERLEPGDELVVRPGERVPVDGFVAEGTAAVDEALVTGESVPVRREPGDEVVGGGVVADGALVVAVGEDADSTLDRLLHRLWEIQSTRPGAQRLADRLATVFVPLVVVLATAVTAYRLLTGEAVADALLTGLAVLVVSCPCALGLATPLAVASGVREALARGVVIADESVFERATETDVVALDKTGTLTTGRMELVDWVGDAAVDGGSLRGENESGRAADGARGGVEGDRPRTAYGGTDPDRDDRPIRNDEVLARAAAVEQFSDHPLAEAVVRAADAPGTGCDVREFERHPGRGVSATVAVADEAGDGGRSGDGPGTAGEEEAGDGDDGRPRTGSTAGGTETVVGRRSLFDERDWPVPAAFVDRYESARAAGRIAALVGWDGRARGVVVAGDHPRPGWEHVVERLAGREGGGGNDGTDRHDAVDLDGSGAGDGDGGGDADGSRRQVVVLTGDDGGAADRFRAHPAIDEVFAGVPPEAKVETVERLRERGTVAMVGDGSNDAPALAAADLGIAMAEGTELAADAADAVVTGELASVPAVFEVTAAAKRRVRQNLGWAFVYNAIAVPLALVGAINPLFAAGAMAASSLLVVANSARSFDVAIPEGVAAGDDGEVGPGTDREPGPGPDDATGAESSPSQ
jgi:Cu2+-exporting ATPase